MVVWRADGSRVHVGEGHGGGADDKGSADLRELDALAELVGGCHGALGEMRWRGCVDGMWRSEGWCRVQKKNFELLKTQRCFEFSLADRVWRMGAAHYLATEAAVRKSCTFFCPSLKSPYYVPTVSQRPYPTAYIYLNIPFNFPLLLNKDWQPALAKLSRNSLRTLGCWCYNLQSSPSRCPWPARDLNEYDTKCKVCHLRLAILNVHSPWAEEFHPRIRIYNSPCTFSPPRMALPLF